MQYVWITAGIFVLSLGFVIFSADKIDKSFETIKEKMGPQLDMFEILTKPRRKIKKMIVVLAIFFSIASVAGTILIEKFFL